MYHFILWFDFWFSLFCCCFITLILYLIFASVCLKVYIFIDRLIIIIQVFRRFWLICIFLMFFFKIIVVGLFVQLGIWLGRGK